MRVLVVGNGASHHIGAFFCNALRELGHEHLLVDEQQYWRLDRSVTRRIAYHVLRGRPLGFHKFNRDLQDAVAAFRPDVVLVTKGAYILPKTLKSIRQASNAVLINYATDDPFNRASNTSYLVEAIHCYDFYMCTKRAIQEDIRRAGCPRVIYVPFGYEPSLHFPETPRTADEAQAYASDVVFIGGADADRAPFFETLLNGIPGLRLRLYGGYWHRYQHLRPYHRGTALGRDFRLALSCTKVAPCLVRRSNRDGHVMRSFEVPACGAFMLAERTEEHVELFQEGKEAAYFSSPGELVEQTRYYLANRDERETIARNGLRMVRTGQHTYKSRIQRILDLVKAETPEEQARWVADAERWRPPRR